MRSIKTLMTLTKGAKVVCLNNPTSEVDVNTPYTFIGYDVSNVPKNDYSATMTWYPSKPIWSPEEYEKIRYKFMMIKLDGISKPQWLKDFDIYEFTD